MSLAKKIDEDLKTAMRDKNTVALDTLRMLKAAVSNYLIEKKKTEIEDSELIPLIQKQVKLRLDSIEAYQKAEHYLAYEL